MNQSLNVEQAQMANPSMPPRHRYGQHENIMFGRDQWKAGYWWGYFDDMGTCCQSFCCPCVQYGENHHAILGGGSGCACFTYFLLCLLGCSWCISWPFRTTIRRRWGIDGNQCLDCLGHTFCSCCSLNQEAREITLRMGIPNPNYSNTFQQNNNNYVNENPNNNNYRNYNNDYY